MNKDEIITFKASDGNLVRFEYRESLPSVCALAREYANSNYPDRYVIFTEKQTAISALGSPLSENESEMGLFMSCILRPSIFPSQAGPISAFSATALAAALEEHSNNEIGIGWVSDIYCNGIKIGCTSVEGKLDNFTSYEYLIVTFAVKLDGKKFTPRLTDMVRQVFEDKIVSVTQIMAKTVLNKFFSIYKELKTPEKHLNGYLSRSVLTDKKIKYIEEGRKKPAKVVGIDKSTLGLIVETKDGKKIQITSPSQIHLPNKL